MKNCPQGTTPVYSGNVIIDCNENPALSNAFGNIQNGNDKDNVFVHSSGPQSTMEDYMNYINGQNDAVEQMKAQFETKMKSLSSRIPTIWNYILVFGLLAILFMLFKNRGK